MKNTTKWKSTLWVCLLLLTGLPGLHAQQETNAIHDMHAKGWLAIIEGDNARDRDKKAEASSRYESALNIYRDIQKQDATFQKEKIAYRITYCENQLAALNGPTPDTVGSEDFKKKYITLLDETKTLRQRLAGLEAKQEADTPTSVEATEQLKKQNIALQQQLQTLRQASAKQAEQPADNQAVFNALKERYNRLKEASERLVARYRDVEAELTKLKTAKITTSDLQDKIRALETNLSTASGELAKTSQQLNSREQELTAVRETMKAASGNRDKQLADLKSQLASLEAARTKAMADLSEKAETLDKLNLAKMHAEKKLSEIRASEAEQHKTFETDLQGEQKKAGQAEAALAKTRDELAAMRKNENDAARSFATQGKELEALREKSREQGGEVAKLNTQITGLTNARTSAMDATVAKSDELDKLILAHKRIQQELVTVKAREASSQNKLKEVDELKSSIAEARGMHDKTAGQLAKYADEQERLTAQLSLARSDLEENHRTNQVLAKGAEENKVNLDALRNSLKKRDLDIKEQVQKNEQLNRELADARKKPAVDPAKTKAQIARLEKEKAELTKQLQELDVLQEQVDVLNKKIAEMRKQAVPMKKAGEELALLKEERDSLRAMNKDHRLSITESRGQVVLLQALVKQYEKADSQALSALKKNEKALRSQLADLTKRNHEGEAGSKSIIEKLEAELKAKVAQFDELKTANDKNVVALASRNKKLAEFGEKRSAMEKMIADMHLAGAQQSNKALKDYEERLRNLDAELKVLSTAKAGLEEQLAKERATSEKIATDIVRIDGQYAKQQAADNLRTQKLNEEFDTLIKQYAEIETNNAQAMDDLQKGMDEVKQERNLAQTDLKFFRKSSEGLKAEYATLTASLAEKEKALASSKTAFETLQVDTQKELATVNHTNKQIQQEATEEITRKTKEIKTLEAALAGAKESQARLQRALKSKDTASSEARQIAAMERAQGIGKLEADLAKRTEELKGSAENLQLAQSEIQKLRKDQQAFESQSLDVLADKTKALDKLKIEYAKVLQTSTGLTKNLEGLTSSQEETHAKLASSEAGRKILAEDAKRSLATIKAMRTQNLSEQDEASRQVSLLQEKLAGMDAQQSESEKQVVDLQKQIAGMQKQHNQIQETFSNTFLVAREESEAAATHLLQQSKEIEGLNTDLTKATADLAALKKENEALGQASVTERKQHVAAMGTVQAEIKKTSSTLAAQGKRIEELDKLMEEAQQVLVNTKTFHSEAKREWDTERKSTGKARQALEDQLAQQHKTNLDLQADLKKMNVALLKEQESAEGIQLASSTQARSMEASIVKLTENNKKLNKQVAETTGASVALRKERDSLIDQINQVKSDSFDLQKKQAGMTDELRAELKTLNADRKAAIESQASLSGKIEALSLDGKKAEQAMTRIQAQFAQVQAEGDALKDLLAERDGAMKSLEVDKAKLEGRVLAMADSESKLASSAKQAAQAHREDLQQVQKQLAEVNAENEFARKKAMAREKASAATQETLNATLVEAKKANQTATTNLGKLREDLELLQAENQDLQDLISASQKEAENQRLAMAGEKQQVLEDFNAQLKSAAADAEKSKGLLERKDTMLADFKAEQKKTAGEFTRLQEQLATAREQQDEQKVEMKASTGALEQLNRNLEVKHEKLAGMLTRQKQSATELAAANKQITELREIQAQAKKSALAQVTALKDSRKDLERSHDETEQALAQVALMAKKQDASAAKVLEQEANLKEQLATAREQQDEQKVAMKASTGALEQLNRNLQTKDEELAGMLTRQKQSATELAAAGKQITELREIQAQAKENALAQATALQDSRKDVERSHDETEQALAQVALMAKKQDASAAKVLEQEANLKKQLADAIQQAADAQMKIAASEQLVLTKQNALKDLAAQVTELGEEKALTLAQMAAIAKGVDEDAENFRKKQAAMEGMLAEAQAHIEQAREITRKEEATRKQIQERLKKIEGDKEQALAQIAAMTLEGDEQATRLLKQQTAMDEQLAVAQKQVAEAQTLTQAKEKSLAQAQASYKKITTEMNEALGQLATMSKTLDAREASSEEKHKALATQLETAQNRVTVMTQSGQKQLDALKRFESERDTLMMQINNLQTNIVNLTKKQSLSHAALKDRDDELSWLRTEREKTLSSLKDGETRQKTMAAASNERIRRLTEDMAQLAETRESLQAQLAEAQKASKTIEQAHQEALTAMQATASKTEKEQDGIRAALQKKLDQAQAEMTALGKSQVAMRKQAGTARAAQGQEVQILVNKLATTEASLADLNKTMQGQVEDLQNELANTQSSLSKLKTSNEKAAEKHGLALASSEKKLAAALISAKKLTDEQKSLKHSSELRVTELGKQLSASQEASKALADKLGSTEQTQKETAKELALMRTASADTTTRLNQDIISLKEALALSGKKQSTQAASMTASEKQLAELHELYGKLQAALEEKQGQLADGKTAHLSASKAFKAELDTTHEELQDARKSLEDQVKQGDTLRASNQTASDKIKAYQSQIKELQSQQLKSTTELAASLKMVKQENTDLVKRVEEKEAALTQASAEAVKQLAALRERLKDTTSEKDVMASTLTGQESLIADLSKDIKQVTTKSEAARAELAALTKANTSLSHALKDQQVKATELTKANAGLIASVSQLQKEQKTSAGRLQTLADNNDKQAKQMTRERDEAQEKNTVADNLNAQLQAVNQKMKSLVEIAQADLASAKETLDEQAASHAQGMNRIKTLTEEIATLRSSSATAVAKKDEVLQGLNKDLEKSDAQIKQMQKALSAADDEAKTASASIQKQLTSSQSALQKSQSEQTRVQNELAALKLSHRKDLDVRGKELLRLQEAYGKSQSQLAKITAVNLKHASEVQGQIAQATSPLKDQLQQMEAERTQLTLNLDKMQANNARAAKEQEQRILSLKQDLGTSARQVTDMKEQLAEMSKLEVAAADYQKAHQIAVAQVQEMQGQLSIATDQIQEANNSAKRAENAREAALTQLGMAMKETERLKKRPAMSPQQLAELASMKNETVTLAKARDDLNRTLKLREQEYATLKASNEELGKAFNHAREQMQASKTKESAEVEKLKEQNNFMKESLEEALKISAESKNQSDKLASDMNKLNTEYQALVKENSEMKSFASANDTKIQSILEKRKNLEILQRQATQELEAMNVKYGELVRKDRANENAATKLDAMEKSVTASKEKLNQRDIEIQRLQARMADDRAMSKAQADSLAARNVSIEQQYQAKLATKDVDYTKLMQMISNKGAEDESIKASLKSATEEITAFKAAIQEKDRELAGLRDGGKSTLELETQLAHLQQTQKADRANFMNEREQLMAQLKDLAKQATASPDDLAKKNKEIVLLKASNREQLIALQSEITSLQTTVVKVETSSANEKKALLTRLDEYEEQIGGNLNDIRSRLKEHDSLKARLSQSGEFENRMVKALEERDQANENLRTLATAVEQTRAQNKKLETDLIVLDEQKEAANERIKILAAEQSQVAGMRQQLEAAQSMVLRQKTDLGRQQRLNDKLALAVDGDNKAKTELMAVSQKASREIAQQKKVNVELALTLEAATKDRNTLAQQVEAQSALLAQMKAQAPSPEANQRMNVLQEENARLSNELQSLEAQLVQSELKVQDLVIQQQEVLIRLKRLLSAANE